MQKNQYTCLIPFYNENWRIINVLTKMAVLIENGKLKSIICVDDGSTDNTTKLISDTFSQVKEIKVVGYEQNSGKSAALKYGLSLVKTSHVLLFDADLNSFSSKSIEQALDAVSNNNLIDALIFRQTDDPLISKILRHDLIISGERILKTSDLKNIFQKNPVNYQIEFVINNYLLRNRKNTFWIPFYSKNHFKLKKWSCKIAFKKTLQCQKELFKFQHLEQWLFFRPKALPHIL
ncbi:glycosyltransferase [Patescibacteria group bacterium]|nr:glycosyltransferase [Patescibacteria group bacterium]